MRAREIRSGRRVRRRKANAFSGSYDPQMNTIFWGTGQPSPDFVGDNREGDNLYSDSIVALDLDTGKLKWHYQNTPHDVHDWDSMEMPVLVDTTYQGQP